VSHDLQYKNENSVPREIRRAIHRVSALLETIDLEFERVLEQRAVYRGDLAADGVQEDQALNVDIVEQLVRAAYPPENEVGDEDYDELLITLTELGVATAGSLKKLIDDYREYALKEDEKTARKLYEEIGESGESPYDVSRLERGIFLALTGLLNVSLQKAFGDAAWNAAWEKATSDRLYE
jgi:hypothetical protein